MSQDKIALDDFELTTNSPTRTTRKRWGWISAAPSEHLIVYRRGQFQPALSRQGGRFFKWPTDAFVLIPTTFKEILFQANQITTDQVDVRVRGMVLYRIADPIKIHRLINFTNRQGAEGKLARVIADMCRSTAKWLVANMRLEECIRRRKEEIAAILKQEVSGVVTEKWGVEIVTIDIQDVYIQDDELFQSIQATFKAEKAREARLAELETRQAIERRRLDTERSLEKNRQELAMEKAERDFALHMTTMEQQKQRDEADFFREQTRVEQKMTLAAYQAEAEQAQALKAAEQKKTLARLEAEALALANNEEIRALRERLVAEGQANRASLERLFLTEALPTIAESMAQTMQNTRMNVYHNGATGPVSMVLQHLDEVLQNRLDALD